jgi:hypothetical protein
MVHASYAARNCGENVHLSAFWDRRREVARLVGVDGKHDLRPDLSGVDDTRGKTRVLAIEIVDDGAERRALHLDGCHAAGERLQ